MQAVILKMLRANCNASIVILVRRKQTRAVEYKLLEMIVVAIPRETLVPQVVGRHQEGIIRANACDVRLGMKISITIDMWNGKSTFSSACEISASSFPYVVARRHFCVHWHSHNIRGNPGSNTMRH